MSNVISPSYQLDPVLSIGFPFCIMLGGIFHFFSNSAVSDLGLHCLHMSDKKDARLVSVKHSLKL